MGDALRVELSEDGADAERLDTLTRYLRQELLQLDVEDVTARRAGEPPPGARAFDLMAVNELMVYLIRKSSRGRASGTTGSALGVAEPGRGSRGQATGSRVTL